ncbi:electron transport complex subunit G [Cycloclasticus sp. 46_120_T64]|mgnify:CR=1 FL=1|nr:electron transport complex subunit G [Cycloclasticus sp. 46_120_T64]
MSETKKTILKSAWVLGLFSLIGIGLVSLTHAITAEKIAENERLFILKNLRVLVPDEMHDNDLLSDVSHVSDPVFGNEQSVKIYKAFSKQQLVAIIAAPTAADGYNGSIKLLVAIRADGELIGVRVVSHQETPGLGDAIDSNKSDWVLGFAGLSLDKPQLKDWQVKRDGGSFDQFTGATITPRAVVKAVRRTLQYYQTHKANLVTQQEHADG